MRLEINDSNTIVKRNRRNRVVELLKIKFLSSAGSIPSISSALDFMHSNVTSIFRAFIGFSKLIVKVPRTVSPGK